MREISAYLWLENGLACCICVVICGWVLIWNDWENKQKVFTIDKCAWRDDCWKILLKNTREFKLQTYRKNFEIIGKQTFALTDEKLACGHDRQKISLKTLWKYCVKNVRAIVGKTFVSISDKITWESWSMKTFTTRYHSNVKLGANRHYHNRIKD